MKSSNMTPATPRARGRNVRRAIKSPSAARARMGKFKRVALRRALEQRASDPGSG